MTESKIKSLYTYISRSKTLFINFTTLSNSGLGATNTQTYIQNVECGIKEDFGLSIDADVSVLYDLWSIWLVFNSSDGFVWSLFLNGKESYRDVTVMGLICLLAPFLILQNSKTYMSKS